MRILQPSIQNNKKILLFSGFLRGLEFTWAPILVLYLTSQVGLSLSELFVLQALFAGINVFLEIPSGILADKLGRRKTVIFGFFLFASGCAYLLSAQNFWQALLSEAIFAVGASAISGANDALLYDSLKEAKEEKSYKKIASLMSSRQFFVGALASFFGGLIASKFGLHVPIAITAISTFILSGLFIFIKEPTIHDPSHDKKSTTIFEYGKEAFQHISKSSFLIWLMVFAIAMGLQNKISFFTYNPYWELKNVPLEWFGYALAAFNIFSAILSKYAHKIIDTIGNFSTKYLLCITAILGFGLMAIPGVTPLIAVLIPLFFQVERGIGAIFVNDILHSHTNSHNRATVISIKAFLVQASHLLLLPFFGLLADAQGLPQTLLYTATFIGIMALTSTFFIKKKTRN